MRFARAGRRWSNHPCKLRRSISLLQILVTNLPKSRLFFVWCCAWNERTLRVMLHATRVITIGASVGAIWQIISDFGAGSKYLALVIYCVVQGSGVGALRTLTYLDGSVIVERLETADEAAHHLSYTLLSDTPFGSCLLTMTLSDLSPDEAELTWTADFQPTSLPANEALSLIEGMLADNCRALKQLFER